METLIQENAQITEATEQTTEPRFNGFRGENGKMISKEEAIKCRWAHKVDGTPTKIYLHRLACRKAAKNGEPIPVRPKKTYEPGSQTHAGIQSPYDLQRRSGYRAIWQVLAERANQPVPISELTVEVNSRLVVEAPEWYNERYGEIPYDVETNAYVMTRAPYNVKIEAMGQRVVQEGDYFMLMTNVTEPRVLKKVGRKPKVKESVTPAMEATVEADTDEAVLIHENEAVEVQ